MTSLLVANRGDIVIRVFRTAHERGIRPCPEFCVSRFLVV